MGQKKQSEKNIKGLVLTLKPDNNQKQLLDKHLNDTRFIYNKYVEEYLKAIKENRLPDYKDYKELRAEHEFLEGLYSWTLQQVKFQFLKTNSINKSKRSNGQKVGLIKFRSKKSHSDYFYINNVNLLYNSDCKSESYVKIPKVGLVNFNCKNIKPEFLNGKIKTCTVYRSKTGVYEISLCIEVNKVHEERVDNGHIGLDFSLKISSLTVSALKHQSFQQRGLKWSHFKRSLIL